MGWQPPVSILLSLASEVSALCRPSFFPVSAPLPFLLASGPPQKVLPVQLQSFHGGVSIWGEEKREVALKQP